VQQTAAAPHERTPTLTTSSSSCKTACARASVRARYGAQRAPCAGARAPPTRMRCGCPMSLPVLARSECVQRLVFEDAEGGRETGVDWEGGHCYLLVLVLPVTGPWRCSSLPRRGRELVVAVRALDASGIIQVCGKKFSIMRRRHHCRMCGHVICYECSLCPRGKRVCTDCRSGNSDALSRRSRMSDPLESLVDNDGMSSVEHACSDTDRGWRPSGPASCAGSVAGGGETLARNTSSTVRHWLTAQSAVAEARQAWTLTIPDFTAENAR